MIHTYRGPLPFREIDTDERVVQKWGGRGLVVAVIASGQNGQVGMGRGGGAEGGVRKGGCVWVRLVGLGGWR